ncbi:MAG: hypothetical protein NTV98_02825 [Candidatus Roizmanbacteria bacterium]|nr:hypothetical protein [Candidatus Roizmanbacteria bacterium]
MSESILFPPDFNPENYSIPDKNAKPYEKIRAAISIGKEITKKEWFTISEILEILVYINRPLYKQIVSYNVQNRSKDFVAKKIKGTLYISIPNKQSSAKIVDQNTPYTSTKELITLIDQLGKEVWIADPYVDLDFLDIIMQIDKKIKLLILTVNTGGSNKKKIFIGMAKRLLIERGNFEIRESEYDFKDRYLIGENGTYILGFSLKDIGKKQSSIALINDLTPSLKKWFQAKWATSHQII